MERAVLEEKQRKAGAESKKRPPLTSDEQGSDPKRVKLESESTSAASSASFLAAFDFTSLPSSLITELIVANIEAFTEPALIALVQTYRQNRSGPHDTSSSPEKKSTNHAADRNSDTPPLVKDEPPDPLQMDVDEEELEYEPDAINMAVNF